MENKENLNKNGNFKNVTNTKNTNKNSKSGFTKTILIPFVSGVVGCAVVIGACFGIPSIRTKLLCDNCSTVYNTSSNGSATEISLSNYSDTAIYAANKILPSIVGISVEYSVSSNYSFFSSRPQSSTATATGSGIILTEDGYILTNNHIVDTSSSESYYEVSSANKVSVKLYNDETLYEGKIVGTDAQTDLAVIKIEKTGLIKAELADSDNVKVGQFAMAVGNPLNMESTVTCGVVSALNRKVESDGKTFTLTQTDAAINAGNSGGALVNSNGEVIGINTLKLSGTGIEGMGFAIPINSTIDITNQLIQYKKVKRPYIGISGIDLDAKTASAYKLVEGVYIKSIEDFSAAEKAGLKPGDVIIEMDGKAIKTMDEINEIKASKQIGDTVTIKVNRDGQEKELSLTFGEQP